MARPRSQNRTIDGIYEIALTHGYKASKRRKPANQRTLSNKKFLPDVISVPKTGNVHRVFEVEKTVTNNTIFKSIASLSSYIRQHKGSHGHLVVPAAHAKFAGDCVDEFVKTVRHFGKKTKGKNRVIPIDVTTFEQVKVDEDKVRKWEQGGRRGAPPKSSYLPR
jgi:hypothetical protein